MDCVTRESFTAANHMSMRRAPPKKNAPLSESAANPDALPSFDSLSPVEQAAGSLGVHPDEWKPIAFMNNGHFDALMKANALDSTLARRIEVCIS